LQEAPEATAARCGPALPVVRNDDWIATLPGPVRNAVRARMSLIRVPAGGVLATAGQPSARIFQIVDGYARVNGVHQDGDDALVTIYIPGNCFGESALISQRAYNHTTVAIIDSQVNVLSARDFWDLYQAHWQIPEALCRKFVSIISRQMDFREAQATLKLGQRIALMFDNFVEHCPGAAHPHGLSVAFPLTQTDIAGLFDVTRQAVQREIAKLRMLRLVEKRGGAWVVRDRRRLAGYALGARHGEPTTAAGAAS
jgi:CRP-like cAMP-binding protein